jgi:Ca2+-binding RTX toxin-like protein
MATVTGTSGFDVITSIFTSIGVNGQPTSGDDLISAGAGDDFISGGLGNDIINGEAGTDTTSYSDAVSGVNVSLTSGFASGGAGFDTLISIENIIGSGFADTITGSSSSNSLRGDAGNDIFIGSAGNDTLDGGIGTDDAANYSQIGTTVTLSAQGVLNKGPLLGTDTLIGIERIIGSTLLGDTVNLSGAIAPATSTTANLSTGLVTVNGPSGVLLINGTPLSFTVSQFENVTGSNLADTITGNSSDNILLGANGNDILNGGAGNDTLNGGADIDTASYQDAIAAVNVSLTNGNAAGGAGFDTLISIENIIGSGFADTITGSSSANHLNGGNGNDSIFGGLGSDLLTGGAGRDTLFGGSDTDPDTFAFASFTDSLLANYDVIGDFTISDIIDRPGLLATSLNTSNGIASSLTASAVGNILNNFSFTSNSSRAFVAIGFSGTFVAFNDGIAGFNEFTDSIVYLPSFNLGGTNSISIV